MNNCRVPVVPVSLAKRSRHSQADVPLPYSELSRGFACRRGRACPDRGTLYEKGPDTVGLRRSKSSRRFLERKQGRGGRRRGGRVGGGEEWGRSGGRGGRVRRGEGRGS